MNLGGVYTADGVAAVLWNDDNDAVDPHLERIKNQAGGEESDEEDEDFVTDKDYEGSLTDDSGEDDSDASDSGEEEPRKRGLTNQKPVRTRKGTRKEISGYKNPMPMIVDSGNVSDSV